MYESVLSDFTIYLLAYLKRGFKEKYLIAWKQYYKMFHQVHWTSKVDKQIKYRFIQMSNIYVILITIRKIKILR